MNRLKKELLQLVIDTEKKQEETSQENIDLLVLYDTIISDAKNLYKNIKKMEVLKK